MISCPSATDQGERRILHLERLLLLWIFAGVMGKLIPVFFHSWLSGTETPVLSDDRHGWFSPY